LPLGFVALTSGCFGTPGIVATSDAEQTATAPPTLTAEATPTGGAPSPTPRVTDPTPVTTPEPDQGSDEPVVLDATALVSLAGVDPSTGAVVVGGFVSGIVETGGICTFRITRNSTEVLSRSTTGTSNADNTSCGSVEIPSGQLAAGLYAATLTYENARGRAVSSPAPLEVP